MAADPRLPAAVSNAGALGTIGLWWVDDAGDLVRQTAALTDRPFGGNFALTSDQHRRVDQALAEIDGAIADARRSAQAVDNPVRIGYGPFSGSVVSRLAEALEAEQPDLSFRLEEEVTSDSLRRVGAHELAAAVVMESPAAARRHGVRIDALKDEPLLAALPESHPLAGEAAISIGAFASECVLLPREPPGQIFNTWLRALFRTHGVDLDRTMTTASAPWDRRMGHVGSGEAVAAVVADWVESMPHAVAVPFDPPLNFPTDLASRWPATEAVKAVLRAAQRVRDAEGWLTERPARSERPTD